MREYLKKLRSDKNMSQKAVADELKISQNYYSSIECGTRQKDLDLSLILKLSELFDVTVEWIIEQEKKCKSV